MYPELVVVPNYPVYYAPGVNTNLFFYDGLYWVYQGDNWYAIPGTTGPGCSTGQRWCRCSSSESL